MSILNFWSESFQIFLSERGDQSIKSQEVLYHKNSPSLNKRAKTQSMGKSAPLPRRN